MREQRSDRTAAKDLDGLPDIVSYGQAGALRYIGIDVREVCPRGLESSPGRIDSGIPDLTVPMNGDPAVTWGLDRSFADGVESRSRGTLVFERRNGK